MALHDRVAALREESIRNGHPAVPNNFHGVDKHRVRQVLRNLDLEQNADLVDAVFALLDDETPSWFSRPPAGATIADGATTAHLGCHIGILQRSGGKLDREGRDYWIKPLRDLGGIEAITLHEGAFIAGHVVAKSGNSSYRLTEDFKAILQAPDDQWTGAFKDLEKEDEERVIDLIREGQAIIGTREQIRTRLNRALKLAVLREAKTGEVVACGAVKNNGDNYRSQTFRDADADPTGYKDADEFGYVVVGKDFTGNRLSHAVAAVLVPAGAGPFYATTDCDRMKVTLRTAGFAEVGESWEGQRGALTLWVRPD